MKFDFAIGNPPYQETQEATSDTPVYNSFMDAAFSVAEKVELITPARFLFNAGKTPKAWNKKILEDEHFTVLYYTPTSIDVFPSVDIKGGVAITYRDKKKDFGAIGTFVSLPELRNIMYKVKATATEGYVDALVFAPESYRLTDKLHSDYPDAQNVLSAGHKYDITTNIFDKLPYVFMDNCPSGKKAYVQIFGRENNKDRTYKWIKRSYIVQHDNLDKYKVLLPKSNGSGSFGEELSSPLVVSPGVGHTQTFLSIGAFDTKSEAQSLLKYVKTKFARTLLGVLKVTQDNKKSVWRFVPLQDFTENSDIDWSKSVKDIDRQLYAKYGLSDEEIAFIESNVKEMA